jgi:hypothetical protein
MTRRVLRSWHAWVCRCDRRLHGAQQWARRFEALMRLHQGDEQ